MVKRRTFWVLILFCCFQLTILEAIDYRPWIGNYYEFEFKSSLLYQTYPFVAVDSKLKKNNGNDFFLGGSLSNAIAPNFSLEVELVGARTRKQCWGVDHLNFSGKLVLLDDIVGDPITFTTGLNLIQTFDEASKDISSFHHSHEEAEFFVAFGSETAWIEEEWAKRWWALAGIGVGNQGSPWLHGMAGYEVRICKEHELLFQLNSLWGLGKNTIKIHDFKGYGPIQHQSIDLGLRYTYLIEFFGQTSLEYSYRIFARNFPARAHQVTLSLLYTFGL